MQTLLAPPSNHAFGYPVVYPEGLSSMRRHTVKLSDDHLSRQAACSAERAVEELIWNALDAGGDRVEVSFEANALGATSAVEVQDWGTGIAESDLGRAFGMVGNSLKNQRRVTADGRAMHGSEGRGRFRALVLGEQAEWTTTYKHDGEFRTYSITMRRGHQDQYVVSDVKAAKRGRTGTKVRITNIDKGELSLVGDATRENLTERLALYLKNYPGLSLVYDNRELDPKPLIRDARSFPLTIGTSAEPNASVEVIEWTFKPETRKLLICDTRGFAWHELPVGIQTRGFEFTAFLKCEQAKEWADEGRFTAGELDQEVTAVIEAARARLREYVRSRLAEEAQGLVQQWKAEQIYPYRDDEPNTPVSQAERQVFDILAAKVHQFHSPFRQGELEARQLILSLVRQALESNPTSLKEILEKTLKLSNEQQDELADLLRRTGFPSLIEAAKTVEHRLRAITGFKHILFDDDWKATLRERTQLHRLLVRHVWIFGDEYLLDTDDEALKAVLHKHRKILKRDELAPESDVQLINGKDGIPDLMLSRKFKRDRRTVEHLILELKRPSLKLGSDEITQIKNYAYTVSDDERFSKTDVSWRFVLLGNSLDTFAQKEINSDGRPFGCIHAQGNLSVWVQEWGHVLHEAEQRYEFFREKLNVEASHADGLAYLKQHYDDLMSGKGLTKKQDVAKHGDATTGNMEHAKNGATSPLKRKVKKP